MEPEDSPERYNSFHFCNPFYPVGSLPLVHIFVLLLSPLFMLMLLNDGKVYGTALICWTVNVACLMLSQCYAGNDNNVLQFTWLVIIELVVLKCMYDVEMNAENNFLIQKERKAWAMLQIKNSEELAAANAKAVRLEMANVAHDLRNPLQAFASGVQYIQTTLAEAQCHVDKKTEMEGVLKEMDSSADFMNVKINRFLDISKSDNDIELKPRCGSFNILESVNWAINVMTSFSKTVTIKLEDSTDTSISSLIISDKTWFEENVLCYISNAVKHTPENGTVTIRYFLKSCDNASRNHSSLLVVEVEDTGIGIDAAKGAALFKPFSQAQSSAGGTGLGLYSLALRSRALGGSYGCRGKPAEKGPGACFYFSVPYIPDDAKNYQSAGQEPCDNTSSGNNDLTEAYKKFVYTGDERRILVVDDNSQVLKVITRGLKCLGIENIENAINGYEALEKMKLKQYSCVLMDAQMPIMDGFESCRRIRSWEKQKESPSQFIICCSANDDSETRSHAECAGMDGYLSKPFKTSKILELLESNQMQ